ncbi:MAG TPA: hypothetical protein VI977_04850 [archaeon]|nr:hypothetical protein [archaeon]
MLPERTKPAVSTKDLVIQILGEEWPLTIKQIHERVKRQSDQNLTYQAVHKLLVRLSNEGVIEKETGKYKLSKTWIFNTKQFIASIDRKYSAKEAFLANLSSFKGSFDFTFNDISDLALSMAEMFLSERCQKATGPYWIGVLRHGWWPLKFSFDQFLLLKKISKSLSYPYSIIRKDSLFARWVDKQYKLANFKSKIIDGLQDYNDDIVIMGSLIAQVNYSNATKKAIDDLYAKIPGLTALFKEYVVPSFPKIKVEINFKMTEDPALAATLGKHYMEIWQKNKEVLAHFK